MKRLILFIVLMVTLNYVAIAAGHVVPSFFLLAGKEFQSFRSLTGISQIL